MNEEVLSEKEYENFLCKIFGINDLNNFDFETVLCNYGIVLENCFETSESIEDIELITHINNSICVILYKMGFSILECDNDEKVSSFKKDLSTLADKWYEILYESNTEHDQTVSMKEQLLLIFFKIINSFEENPEENVHKVITQQFIDIYYLINSMEQILLKEEQEKKLC